MFGIEEKSKRKIMKKFITAVVAVALLASGFNRENTSAEAAGDGNYKVPVSLLKKYDNEVSMGNNALYPEGIVEVKNGKMKMKVRFTSLKFMNFTGYLSSLEVKGRAVKVLSRYENYDSYNNPENGTDKKFRGIKYPKDMEFEVEKGENNIPVKVYVPVMAELGSGEQEARLNIKWPDNMGKGASSEEKKEGKNSHIESEEKIISSSDGIKYMGAEDNRNLPKLQKGEKLSLENGIYEVEAEIYNEREDKPSMGNKSMSHTAEIISKDGKYRMLIGSDKMTVQNITASLVSLQIRDDNGRYFFAEPHAFDLEIEGDPDKRPKVFDFEIERKDPMMYIKVDPKVKPMGEVPIGARLKINWETLKKIDESGAKLYKDMKDGTPRPVFNPDAAINKTLDGINFFAPAGTFRENIRFKYEVVFGGTDYINIMNKLGRGKEFVIYGFKAENDYGIQQKNNKDIKITMDRPKGFESGIKAKYADDMSEIPLQIKNGKIEMTLKRLGKVVIISENASGGNVKSNTIDKKSNQGIKGGKKSKVSGVKKSSGPAQNSRKTSSIKKSSATGNSGEKNEKTAPVSLKNDDRAFNESLKNSKEDKSDSEIKSNEGNTQIESQESVKIIFFSVLIIGSLIGGSIYVYSVYGKKLLYEIGLNKSLKKYISKKAGER